MLRPGCLTILNPSRSFPSLGGADFGRSQKLHNARSMAKRRVTHGHGFTGQKML